MMKDGRVEKGREVRGGRRGDKGEQKGKGRGGEGKGGEGEGKGK
jgi:hypothetical protein